MKFCSACGHEVSYRVPIDDNRVRAVCTQCATVHYVNPRVIVGCIPEAADGRILMCRRDIEPRRGKWTFPAGFLEINETSAAGAAREALEESCATVEIRDLFCVIDVPRVQQVYLLYRAHLPQLSFAPTPESSEVVLMTESEIPWDDIAFPTVYQGLRHFFADRAAGVQAFHHFRI